MPIRFSTQAANADKLEADDDVSTPQAKARAAPKPPQAGRQPGKGDGARQGASDVAKPGKDINAAGFIKDRDPET